MAVVFYVGCFSGLGTMLELMDDSLFTAGDGECVCNADYLNYGVLSSRR